MIISPLKRLTWIVPVAFATTGDSGYYPLYCLEYSTPSLPTTVSALSHNYLLKDRHCWLAQSLNVTQLLLVLTQTLGNHQLDLHALTVVFVLDTVTITSTSTTRVSLLWFFLILRATTRPTLLTIYLELDSLWWLRFDHSLSFRIGLILSRSLSIASLFYLSVFSCSSFLFSSFSFSSSSP